MQNFQGIILYELKDIERFSSLHQCTFNYQLKSKIFKYPCQSLLSTYGKILSCKKSKKSTTQLLTDRCTDIQMYERMCRGTDRQIGLILQDPFIVATPLFFYKMQGVEFSRFSQKKWEYKNFPIKREGLVNQGLF